MPSSSCICLDSDSYGYSMPPPRSRPVCSQCTHWQNCIVQTAIQASRHTEYVTLIVLYSPNSLWFQKTKITLHNMPYRLVLTRQLREYGTLPVTYIMGCISLISIYTSSFTVHFLLCFRLCIEYLLAFYNQWWDFGYFGDRVPVRVIIRVP